MLFTDLPEHCLLLILDRCELNTLATLTTVCSKFKEIICAHIFRKSTTFTLAAVNTQDIAHCLVTVSRLIRAVDPTNFNVQIYRNLQALKEMPLISVDTTAASTAVFVESHFLGWLHCLNNICTRIAALTIYCSLYDSRNNDQIDLMNVAAWTNLKQLHISGHDRSVSHLMEFPKNIWDIDMMLFRCMFIGADFVNDAVEIGSNLKNIVFQKCSFNDLLPIDIVGVAETVRYRGGHFPLGLTFLDVDIVWDDIFEVMENADVRDYVYIQQEPMFADLP